MTSLRMRDGVLCAAVMLVLVIGSPATAGRAVVVARMRVDFVPHLLATYCYPYLPPRVTVNVFPRR